MNDQCWDSAQKNAIYHRDGPLLVSAGPGSGKTTVIISHLQYLISKLHIEPDKILVVTFTKAAAQEMKERFMSMCKASEKTSSASPRFGTMHSVFFEILKKSKPHRSFCFIKDLDRTECLKSLVAPYLNSNADQNYTNSKSCYDHLNDIDDDSANYHANDIDIESENDLIRRLTAHMSKIVNTGEYRYGPRSSSGPCSSYTVSGGILPFPGLSNAAVMRIFHEYQSFKRLHGLVDFDDILVETLRLLSEDHEAAAYWQQKYQYILVDEFQDINELQYRCLHILEKPWNNLYVVGDEDQSIYGFRGSSPDIINRFLADHPGCRTVTLEHNYRAPDILLVPARKLIRHNKHRTDKQITGRPLELDNPIVSFPDVASYQLNKCYDQWDEYRMIAETARRYKSLGISFHQQVILLRSFRNLPEIMLCLQQYGIPAQTMGAGHKSYKSNDKDNHNSYDRNDKDNKDNKDSNNYDFIMDSLLSHFITKDIMAYIQLASLGKNMMSHSLFHDPNRNSDVTHELFHKHTQELTSNLCHRFDHDQRSDDKEPDFLSLLQRIRHISLPHVSRYSLTKDNPLPINPQGQKELRALQRHLEFLSDLSPYPACEYICKAMGYEQYLRNLSTQHQSSDHIYNHTNQFNTGSGISSGSYIGSGISQGIESRVGLINIYSETLENLNNILRQFKTKEAFIEYVKQGEPFSYSNAANLKTVCQEDMLQIRTMHSSKGLEYDVVFIPNLNKGILPDSRAVGDAIEEERRLLYVAMTRARRHLHMFYVERIRGKPVFPSIFVQELIR